VGYSGAFYKQTEFQSIFGISKTHQEFGEHYYLLLDFNDAFQYGGWSKTEQPEYKFDKLITDNEFGRYINGGINRVAILTQNNIFLTIDTKKQDDNVKDTFTPIDFETNDSFTVSINNKPYIIIKEFEQQISLSFHKINKFTLGSQWVKNNSNNNICYSIE
jgi:hypothetical protein